MYKYAQYCIKCVVMHKVGLFLGEGIDFLLLLLFFKGLKKRGCLFLREVTVKIEMKYVLVTGGVVSGLGKGVTASSIGLILKACGLRVTSIKIGIVVLLCSSCPFEHFHSRSFFF